MRNILSYQYPAVFSGAEILNWAQYHFKNHTSHYKYANMILLHYSNLKSDKMYRIQTNYSGTGCGEIIRKPIILNI